MLYRKRLNPSVLLICLVIIIALTGLSYLAAVSTQSSGFHLFQIFRFPTHALMWDYFRSSSTMYRLGLVLNIGFYALLLERVVSIFRPAKK